MKQNNLVNIEKLKSSKNKLKVEDKSFEKLMFIYDAAIKELVNKIEILEGEYNLSKEYDLIDHIDTRIKTPSSITSKMKQKNLKLNYYNMIQNINDIAGIRIICSLKKDIFIIKELIEKINGIVILKQKDYVTYPKDSGYSSYHLIVEIPVNLSNQEIYVKVEIQIRTLAMDFWANLEHKMKYKPKEKISKETSIEWVKCSKIINELDNKMLLLN